MSKLVEYTFRKSESGLIVIPNKERAASVQDAKATACMQKMLSNIQNHYPETFQQVNGLERFHISLIQPKKSLYTLSIQGQGANPVRVRITNLKPVVVEGFIATTEKVDLWKKVMDWVGLTEQGLGLPPALPQLACLAEAAEQAAKPLSFILLANSLWESVVALKEEVVNFSSPGALLKALFDVVMGALRIAVFFTGATVLSRYFLPVNAAVGVYEAGSGLYDQCFKIYEGKQAPAISALEVSQKVTSILLSALAVAAMLVSDVALGPYLIFGLSTLNFGSQVSLYFAQ